jgi:hypothetical protein
MEQNDINNNKHRQKNKQESKKRLNQLTLIKHKYLRISLNLKKCISSSNTYRWKAVAAGATEHKVMYFPSRKCF